MRHWDQKGIPVLSILDNISASPGLVEINPISSYTICLKAHLPVGSLV